MTKKNIVNLDEWYTNDEAVKRLSENSHRPIDRNYPRTLARYNKIDSIEIGARGKLYRKSQVDTYVVSPIRGRKKHEAH